MKIKAAEISDILRRQIRDYDREIDVAETGTVLSIGDGIARVYGLENAMAGELVEFPGNINGMVLNLEEDNVGIALMGETSHVREGDLVRRTGRIIEVPVGEGMVGRVVDALGQPIDGKGEISTSETRRVELKAPGIVERQRRHVLERQNTVRAELPPHLRNANPGVVREGCGDLFRVPPLASEVELVYERIRHLIEQRIGIVDA